MMVGRPSWLPQPVPTEAYGGAIAVWEPRDMLMEIMRVPQAHFCDDDPDDPVWCVRSWATHSAHTPCTRPTHSAHSPHRAPSLGALL